MESSSEQAQRPASVGRAWTWLLVFTGGMVLIGFLAWGSLGAAPPWFHALFAFQVLWAVAGVVSAHKRRAGHMPE